MGTLHKDLVGDELHIGKTTVSAGDPNSVVTAGVIGEFYWDSTNKIFYIAEAIDNASWIPSGALDEWIDLTDTPVSISANLVVQGNTGGTALEFGQNLNTIGNPTFDNLTLTGNLTVQGATVTLDAQTLLVEDKNIELGNVTIPTDVTADGGGITLKGTVDKTIKWVNAKNAWEFSQSVDLLGNNLITTGDVVTGKVKVDNLQLDGNTLSSTNINGDLILDAFAAGTGVVKVTDQLIIEGSTSQLLLNDTDNDKTYILKSNLGDFSIVEIGGNNVFKIKTGAAVNSLDINPTEVTIGTKLIVDNLSLDGNTISSTDINGNINLSPNGTGNVSINGQIKIAGGTPAIDRVLTSIDVGGNAEWREDLANVIAQETFASTNVRFFGELALPAAQGWTDTATGIATIDLVTQTVFGEVKQVVRHNDDTADGSTTSKITLTTQNWVDINAFGASYSGTTRLDTVDGVNGFFSGLQVNAAENPLATGNRRYGVLFNNNGGNLRLIEADNNPGNSVTMDGTGGNPAVLFDEWFKWECVVPAGLGAAEFYVNGVLTTFVPLFLVNGGGLGTQIIVSSGSTSGANRIVYHDNFGVTIFEEAATKTLAVATMVADVAQINIPEGKRDYTIILPDGNPRLIGSVLRLVVNNLFGTVTLQNQTPATPEALFNGLAEIVFTVFSKEIVDGINTVDQGNVYIGFKAEDVARASAIFAQLHSIIDQIPTDVNPTVITYTNHDAINGIGHSTTINTGELEILPGFEGTYSVIAQPQVGKNTGGTKVDFDMFLQVDRGAGFVDEPNSNAELTIKDSDITDVIVSAITIQLQSGDKLRMMQAVSDAAVGMGLKNTDPVVGPPTKPRTPSIIFAMHRVGDI